MAQLVDVHPHGAKFGYRFTVVGLVQLNDVESLKMIERSSS